MTLPRAEIEGRFLHRQRARLRYVGRSLGRLCRAIMPLAFVAAIFFVMPITCGRAMDHRRGRRVQREVELVEALARTMLELYTQQPISDQRIEGCLHQRAVSSCLGEAFDLGELGL